MPTPTFVAFGTLTSSLTTPTIPWPVGNHQANDIGLLVCESCGGEPVTLSTAAGFAAVTNSPQATGATTSGTQVTVFWCRATSSSMTSPILNDAGDHTTGVILVFRGCVTSGNPWNVTAGGVKAGASTSGSVTGLTTTVDDCLVVNCATHDLDSAAAAFSAQANATLSQLTERHDAGSTTGNGGGIMVATGVRTNAGVVNATTFTVTSSINAYLTVALKGDLTAPTAGPPTIPYGRGLVKQDFAVADGTAVANMGWATSGSGGVTKILSNGLRMGLDGLTGAYAESCSAYLATPNNTSYCRLPVGVDWTFAVDFVVEDSADENYMIMSMADANNGAGIAVNGYTLSLGLSGGFYTYILQRRDAGANTDLGSVNGTPTLNTTYRFLMSRRGNFIGAKMWAPTGSPVPATWAIAANDSRYRGPKYAVPMLGLLGGNVAGPSEVYFRNVAISVPSAYHRAGP